MPADDEGLTTMSDAVPMLCCTDGCGPEATQFGARGGEWWTHVL